MERAAPSRRVPLPLLLLGGLALLAAGVDADVLLEGCCADGQRMATNQKDCSLPYATESKECRMVQEQCCHSQLEELHCATGISLANQQDHCVAPRGDNASLEATFVKRCCHCCLLGRAAQAQGQSCEYSLMVGYQCGQVFRACCVKSQETGDLDVRSLQETDKITEVAEEQEDPYLNDRCRGGGPCKQQCRDTGDEVVCSCFVGYQLLSDGVSCEDVNECITGSHSCRLGESCINTVGSFRCQRDSSCGTGYELTEDNSCKDIDECESGIHNCLPDFICQNTLGSFRCRPKLQCKSGFIQDALGNCIDINECLSISAPCPTGHTCINTEGSYTCQKNVPNCGRGYHLNEEGTRCVGCSDINECSSSPCSQECANVYGSYQCYCRRGYQLSDVDGVTCEDIDECALPTGGHICSYRCINIPGSFQCSCPSSGYRLAPNGRNCQDIDECVTGIHNCSINETCFNIQGGFRCLVFECPENYRRSAATLQQEKTDTIRCIKSCRPNDVTCVFDPVHTISHTVISLPTFREFTRPEEIIFLRAITPPQPASQANIIFDITEGNLRDSFDIIKRYMDGMTVGVVRQVRPIVGPFHAILKLEMNYVVGGVVSHRNVVNVHIFVSEYWF
ncbi:fibulin-1 [Theropithecus gelada]|uniref:fibulin-1 n=1 Tax=Theropithecus gelada TaxID=9565 RepID=UPI000DC1B3E5|nr:fibulin-1 [Theropithecus gelada]